jgi:hypothetical protein
MRGATDLVLELLEFGLVLILDFGDLEGVWSCFSPVTLLISFVSLLLSGVR